MFSAMWSDWCDLEEEKKIKLVTYYYTSYHYTISASPWCCNDLLPLRIFAEGFSHIKEKKILCLKYLD